MDKQRCKANVYHGGSYSTQCLRYAVRDGYCKIHHRANSPYMHMERLQAEVERLRAALDDVAYGFEQYWGDKELNGKVIAEMIRAYKKEG